MTKTPLYGLCALAALLLIGAGQEGVGVPSEDGASPHEEMQVGRYWHAARLLRASGAASGSNDQVLLLARAEAGWRNWPAVAELLVAATWLSEADNGDGWLLLGRAQEALGRWPEAAEAYEKFLTLTTPGGELEGAIRARLARVVATAGCSSPSNGRRIARDSRNILSAPV